MESKEWAREDFCKLEDVIDEYYYFIRIRNISQSTIRPHDIIYNYYSYRLMRTPRIPTSNRCKECDLNDVLSCSNVCTETKHVLKGLTISLFIVSRIRYCKI